MKLARRRRPQTSLQLAWHYARRLVVAVMGGTVLLLGMVMLLTPGPALVVIPVGLAILGIEFAWARRLLKRVRSSIENGLASVSGGPAAKPPEAAAAEDVDRPGSRAAPAPGPVLNDSGAGRKNSARPQSGVAGLGSAGGQLAGGA